MQTIGNQDGQGRRLLIRPECRGSDKCSDHQETRRDRRQSPHRLMTSGRGVKSNPEKERCFQIFPPAE